MLPASASCAASSASSPTTSIPDNFSINASIQAAFTPRPVASRPILAATTQSSSLVSNASSPVSLQSPISSGMGSGPVQFSRSIPPRPKPGRKPATDEPGSKRKAQNREAQRSFRIRKALKLEELGDENGKLEHLISSLQHENQALRDEARVTHAEQGVLQARLVKLQGEYDQLSASYASQRQTSTSESMEREAFANENQRLASERDYWKAKASSTPTTAFTPNHAGGDWANRMDETMSRTKSRVSDAQSYMQSFTNPNAALAPPTPPENQALRNTSLDHVEFTSLDEAESPSNASTIPSNENKTLTEEDYAENEIDFTTAAMPKRPKLPQRTSVAFVVNNAPVKPAEPCGFCADGTYCPCSEDAAAAASTDIVMQTDSSASDPMEIEFESSCPPSGPGSCDRCMTDPEQRAWCRGLSKIRNTLPSINNNRTNPSSSSSLSTLQDSDSKSSSSSSSLSSSGNLASDQPIKCPDTLEPHFSPNTFRSRALVGGRYSVVGCDEAYSLLGRPSIDQKPSEWSKNIVDIHPTTSSSRLNNPQDSSSTSITTSTSSGRHQRSYSAWELQIANHMIEVATANNPSLGSSSSLSSHLDVKNGTLTGSHK